MTATRIILRLLDDAIYTDTKWHNLPYDSMLEVYLYEDEAIITSVYTHGINRGKGYASRLMLEACRIAKEQGYESITLTDSSDTGRLYHKLGFVYLQEGQPEMIKYL
jgi:GNAT superfamily N-acetyltransferase